MANRLLQRATPNISKLDKLLSPASIAVIGASDDPARIGGRPVHFLNRFAFPGKVALINPARDVVQGRPCFKSLADVPYAIDHALIAVPARAVAQALRDCSAKGVPVATVFSSGFADIGQEGMVLQDEVCAIAGEAGIRLLGPNCLGSASVPDRCYATFSQLLELGTTPSGRISMVCQSGAFGSHVFYLAQRRGIGVARWITTGNQADVDVADCIAWLAQDDATDVILFYLEGCDDADKLLAAIGLAHANGKPLIAMKVGTSEAGQAAAASHTGALAVPDTIIDAVFRQYGVYRAHSIDEFLSLGEAVARIGTRRIASGGLGIYSVSGGLGVMIADEASRHGIAMPPLSTAAQAAILERIPFAGVHNPLDATAQINVDPSLLELSLGAMLADGYSSCIIYLSALLGVERLNGPFSEILARLHQRHPDIVKVLCVLAPEHAEPLRTAGYLVASEPAEAVHLVTGLTELARLAQKAVRPIDVAPAPDIPGGALGESESRHMLADAGIPMVSDVIAQDADQAVVAASKLGWPVVLKVASPDIAHKSEVGGVALDLKSADEVRSAFTRITDSARRGAPGAVIQGVLVSPMIGDGVETIVGAHRDPTFGMMVMFGLGGIFVEVLKDISFRRAPIDRDEAMSMIRSIAGFDILNGARGRPAADIDALAETLSRLSYFAAAHEEYFSGIEVNPLIVRARGDGVVAVDALITRG